LDVVVDHGVSKPACIKLRGKRFSEDGFEASKISRMHGATAMAVVAMTLEVAGSKWS